MEPQKFLLLMFGHDNETVYFILGKSKTFSQLLQTIGNPDNSYYFIDRGILSCLYIFLKKCKNYW